MTNKMKQINGSLIEHEAYEAICELVNQVAKTRSPVQEVEFLSYEISCKQELKSSSSDGFSGEDEFNNSLSDKSSTEEDTCETVCEIITYEAVCGPDSSDNDNSETICEIVEYEVTCPRVVQNDFNQTNVEANFAEKEVDNLTNKVSLPDFDDNIVGQAESELNKIETSLLDKEVELISENIYFLEENQSILIPNEVEAESNDKLELNPINSIEINIIDKQDELITENIYFLEENQSILIPNEVEAESNDKLELNPINSIEINIIDKQDELITDNIYFLEENQSILIPSEVEAESDNKLELNPIEVNIIDKADELILENVENIQENQSSLILKDELELNQIEVNLPDNEVESGNIQVETELNDEPDVEISKSNPSDLEIYYETEPEFSNFLNEKCRHHKITATVDWNTFSGDILEFYQELVPAEAKHGDIITTSVKNLRSMEVYFVNCFIIELEANKRFKLVKQLLQEDPSGSGYCCVPLEIAKKIADPVKFYENAFTFDNYDEVDFSGIEIDTELHQDVIKRFTGGKLVSPNRKCFYFFSNNEWDSTCGNLWQSLLRL